MLEDTFCTVPTDLRGSAACIEEKLLGVRNSDLCCDRGVQNDQIDPDKLPTDRRWRMRLAR